MKTVRKMNSEYLVYTVYLEFDSYIMMGKWDLDEGQNYGGGSY